MSRLRQHRQAEFDSTPIEREVREAKQLVACSDTEHGIGLEVNVVDVLLQPLCAGWASESKAKVFRRQLGEMMVHRNTIGFDQKIGKIS
jgi:hypothetical protein